jgi:MFS family permease
MLSLATFGAGFVTRPIGALVIGAYSDRAGRRAAMTLSFVLMGAAVAALALTPSYAAIGPAAPVLALIARMVQGFSLGGEVGPTTAFLLEAAPLETRGLVVAWQGASQGVAAIAGSAIGIVLSTGMTPAALDAYGWRIAFLVGAVTLPFGLWIRRRLPETLHLPEPTAGTRAVPVSVGSIGAEPAVTKASPERRLGGVVHDNARIIVLGLLVLAAGTIATYVRNYMTTFAQSTLHLGATAAFAAGAAGNAAAVVAILYGGRLSDRIGRRPAMIWPNLAFLIAAYPTFYWIVVTRSAPVLLLGSAILGFIGSVANGAFYPALTESLPKHIRGRAVATLYAVSIAVFGGTTQLVITWLIHVTGNPLAPAWYLVVATLVGQIAMLLILESAPAARAAAYRAIQP